MSKVIKYIWSNCEETSTLSKEDKVLCSYYSHELVDEKLYEDVLKREEEIYKEFKKINNILVTKYIKAFFKLIKDSKVKKSHKDIAIAALLYLINPIDIISDWIPVIGHTDDIVTVIIAVGAIGNALNYYVEQK